MTQIAFIPIAAETELAYICTSGIYPICRRLSQARGFQHHLDNSSCQTVPTPGSSPEKTNLDWDYIVLSIIKLDRNQAIHLDWFFSRASQIKPLDGLQQEKPSSFFMATPRWGIKHDTHDSTLSVGRQSSCRQLSFWFQIWSQIFQISEI